MSSIAKVTTTRLFIPNTARTPSKNRPYFTFVAENERDSSHAAAYFPQADVSGWFSKTGGPLWYYRNPVTPDEQNTYVPIGAEMQFLFYGKRAYLYGHSWAGCTGGFETCPLPSLSREEEMNGYNWTFAEDSADLKLGYLFQYDVGPVPIRSASSPGSSASSSPYKLTLTGHDVEDPNGTLAISSYPFAGYTPSTDSSSGTKTPSLLPIGMNLDFALVDLEDDEPLDPSTDLLLAHSTDPSFLYSDQWTHVDADSTDPAMYPTYISAHVGDSVTWTFFGRSVAVMGTYNSGFFDQTGGGSVNLSVTLDGNPSVFVVEGNVAPPKPPNAGHRTIYQNSAIPRASPSSPPGTAASERHTLTIKLENPTDITIALIGIVYAPSFNSFAQLAQWTEEVKDLPPVDSGASGSESASDSANGGTTTSTAVSTRAGIGAGESSSSVRDGDTVTSTGSSTPFETTGGTDDHTSNSRTPFSGGRLAGAVVGTLVFFGLLLVGCWLFLRRRRKRRQQGVQVLYAARTDSSSPTAFLKSYHDARPTPSSLDNPLIERGNYTTTTASPSGINTTTNTATTTSNARTDIVALSSGNAAHTAIGGNTNRVLEMPSSLSTGGPTLHHTTEGRLESDTMVLRGSTNMRTGTSRRARGLPASVPLRLEPIRSSRRNSRSHSRTRTEATTPGPPPTYYSSSELRSS